MLNNDGLPDQFWVGEKWEVVKKRGSYSVHFAKTKAREKTLSQKGGKYLGALYAAQLENKEEGWISRKDIVLRAVGENSDPGNNTHDQHLKGIRDSFEGLLENKPKNKRTNEPSLYRLTMKITPQPNNYDEHSTDPDTFKLKSSNLKSTLSEIKSVSSPIIFVGLVIVFVVLGIIYEPPRSSTDKPVEYLEVLGAPTKPEPHLKLIGAIRYSQREVTNADYLKFTNANPLWRKGHSRAEGYSDGDYLIHWPSWEEYPSGLSDHPVTRIPWTAAKEYCEWLGGRLPTLEEWIIAAENDHQFVSWQKDYKNDITPPFNFCDKHCLNRLKGEGGTHSIDEYTHYEDDYLETSPVFAFSGEIVDLYGNVWEWLGDGVTGSIRLTAGGSFRSRLDEIMSKTVNKENMKLSADDGGVRCVFE